jgi:hypothetical protein
MLRRSGQKFGAGPAGMMEQGHPRIRDELARKLERRRRTAARIATSEMGRRDLASDQNPD